MLSSIYRRKRNAIYIFCAFHWHAKENSCSSINREYKQACLLLMLQRKTIIQQFFYHYIEMKHILYRLQKSVMNMVLYVEVFTIFSQQLRIFSSETTYSRARTSCSQNDIFFWKAHTVCCRAFQICDVTCRERLASV